MIINRGNLANLRVGFSTAFQQGRDMVEDQSGRVATTVPSTTSEQKYGWLGKVPNVREWVGDRVVQNMEEHDYAIKNKKWELTIGVNRDHIEDDNLGIYAPLFTEMGRSTQDHRQELIWSLLAAGFSTPCYDGQNFFDTDHPVLDENGNEISVSNTGGGSGAPWFLVDDTRALKPILFQERSAFDFVSKDSPDDDTVFEKDEFHYGTRGRHNVGFGFWQFAYGSKDDLSPENYETARAALQSMTGDFGRKMGIRPRLLVVGPSREGQGRKIVNAENDAAGATNVWRGTAELLVVPWLA
jgi:phage major head subunit gpT-like protein